jgi:hypothetical protein
MIKTFIISIVILVSGVWVNAQNLATDMGKANQILRNTSIFSIEFRYNYYAGSVNEKPVYSVINKAYRYNNRFSLEVENKELVYQDSLLLTKDNDNGVLVLENAKNPINEMLSPQNLISVMKNFKYTYKVKDGKKIYRIAYPKNNSEKVKEVIVILNEKNCFFERAQIIFNSSIGTYSANNNTSVDYSIMEIRYSNFKKDDAIADGKTQIFKYIRFEKGKAVAQQKYSRYAISDIRKKNKSR